MEPLGTLRLGEREFPVPPLTLGRFQRLLSAETQAVVKGLMAERQGPVPLSVRIARRILRSAVLRRSRFTPLLWKIVDRFHIGRGLYRATTATELACLLVPGLTPRFWKEHASQVHVLDMFLLFARGHEWGYISDAISFGEPLEEGEVLPSPDDITAGLLSVARETGHTIEQLSTMRVEGFYRLTAAIRAKAEAQERTQSEHATPGGPLPGIEYVSEVPASLADLLNRATGDLNA